MTRVLKQGEYTSTVYKLIADGDYKEAANILETEMKRSGQESRAALSLIGESLLISKFMTFDGFILFAHILFSNSE